MTYAAQGKAIGIIGGGPSSVVGRAHFAAARMDGAWTPEAGVLSSFNKIEATEFHAVARQYSSIDEFISAERGALRLVSVVTPTPSHREVVGRLLEAGFNVLCEKALCTSSEDARELVRIASTHDCDLWVCHNYAFFPVLIALRRYILNGNFDNVLSARAQMLQDTFVRDTPLTVPVVQSWRQDRSLIPALQLDLATHLLHLIEFVGGQSIPPLRVIQTRKSRRFPGLESRALLINERGASPAHEILVGKDFPGKRNDMSFEITFESVSFSWSLAESDVIQVRSPGGGVEVWDTEKFKGLGFSAHPFERFKSGHPVGFVESIANLYLGVADFYSGHSDGADLPTGTGAARILRILESAQDK